jgi:hypothetical protein
MAEIVFFLFSEARLFNRIRRKKHFKSDLVSGCVSSVSSCLVFSTPPRRVVRSGAPKGVAHISDYRNIIRPTMARARFERIRLNASGLHR